MKVTVTVKQLKKIRELSDKDFTRLLAVVRNKGQLKVTKAEMDQFDFLRRVSRIIRGKKDLVWAAFSVDGVRPSPYVGVRGKKEGTEPQRVMRTFAKMFREFYRKPSGTLSTKEWALCARLAKEYDLEELDHMMRRYFSKTGYTQAEIPHFYNQRNRLHREVCQEVGDVGESAEGVSTRKRW